MTEMLCLRFPVSPDGDFIYIRRPNRTRESNAKLRRILAMTVLLMGVVMLSLLFVLGLVWFYLELLDKTFLIGYSGCDEKLNELSEKGMIDDYSINWSWWRTKAVLADLIENLIIWGDSSIAVFSGLQLSVVLNYDLVLYWRHLHARVLSLKQRLEMDQETDHPRLFSRRSTGSRRQCYLSNDLTGLQIYRGSDFEASLRDQSYEASNNENPQPTNRYVHDPIQLLKHQFHDFIREIKRVDSFISDTISLTLAIWLFIFSSYVHAFQYLKLEKTAGRSLVVIAPLFLITFNCILVLVTHRYCSKTYPVLCSVMALNQSPRDKKSLMSVLNYFNDRRTCYTLFRQSPFLPSTYLSIMGWSFSCFFIISSMTRHP